MMMSASDIAVDNDDIVEAGVKRYQQNGQGYYWEYCDSLVIAKYSS
jgi:hypothetical protein